MTEYKTIYLKKGKEDSLTRKHPWIFSGAISRCDDNMEEGEVVRVISGKGDFIAIGHWQIGSIAIRVLSFDDVAIDGEFYENKLSIALDVRKSIGLLRGGNNIDEKNINTTYRLVHGEGDGLPGLVIDMYDGTAVMQAHSIGMHVHRHIIAESLKKVMGEELKAVYYKSETTLPFKADLGQENGFLIGKSTNDVAHENGLKFHIDWLKGQKTGFFIDQRDNRALLEQYSKGRRVLNMFCYTGGFSVYSMRGGAELVHSVDSSSKAVELVNKNIALNFPGDTRHQAFAADAFKFLDEMASNYDLVILDPPAFAKHRDALKQALRGYTKLNAKAMEKMPSGSILFTFSCSQAVNKEQFRTAIFAAALQTGRQIRILHQLHQPADHPININHPEGEYLKGLVVYLE
jgi:23S rRNA (cytosine1962-C5)-methyltransferase